MQSQSSGWSGDIVKACLDEARSSNASVRSIRHAHQVSPVAISSMSSDGRLVLTKSCGTKMGCEVRWVGRELR